MARVWLHPRPREVHTNFNVISIPHLSVLPKSMREAEETSRNVECLGILWNPKNHAKKKLDMALLAVWPRWKDQGPQIYIKIQSTSSGPLMVFIFQPYAPNLDMLESRSATKKTQKRRQARPSRFPPHPTTTPTAVNSCFPSDPEQSRTKHRFISNAPGLGTKNMETLLLQVSGIPSFSGPRT